MKKADSILSPYSLQKNIYIHSYYGNKIICAYGKSAQPRVKKKKKTMQNTGFLPRITA